MAFYTADLSLFTKRYKSVMFSRPATYKDFYYSLQ